jgi:hypothetical protein
MAVNEVISELPLFEALPLRVFWSKAIFEPNLAVDSAERIGFRFGWALCMEAFWICFLDLLSGGFLDLLSNATCYRFATLGRRDLTSSISKVCCAPSDILSQWCLLSTKLPSFQSLL